MRFLLTIALYFSFMSSAFTQLSRLEKNKSLTPNKAYILPTGYFRPETGLAVGVAGISLFQTNKTDSISNLSRVGGSLIYTQKKQILAWSTFQLYFKENLYQLRGELSFYKYPYLFNGIGNIPESAKPNDLYTSSFPRIRVEFLKQVIPNLFIGPRYWFQNLKMINNPADSSWKNWNVPGRRGGVNSAFGYVIQYDKRDNIFDSESGFFLELGGLHNQSFFGSDFKYNFYQFDIRKYFEIKETHTIALRFHDEIKIGDVPFNRLAMLGGHNLLRGYRQGKYRDKMMSNIQAEYRSPLWTKFNVGLAAFTGAGMVYRNFSDFNLNYLKPTLGAGLRIALNKKEKINLRIDYGFGIDGNRSFYLAVGEAF